ncbi:MAG TPA: hypothetical protein VF857_10460, partial [Spirochaetota bacterium]
MFSAISTRHVRFLFFPFLILIILFFNSCASYNTKEDYFSSKNYLSSGDPKMAIDVLPVKEKGTFIDLMERCYLNLLAGNPDIDGLLKYSKKIDNQVRYKVSREVKSLFYVETPEGYYASEHEIIWMHLLLSWGFSMRHDYENAGVEAKIASNLLSMDWSPEGRFDDPLLRIILGSLWAMAGNWDDARVDFRAAYKLDPKLAWAKTLADMDKKPARLVIVLGGVGPEPRVNPNSDKRGIRGYRDIAFEGTGAKSPLLMKEPDGQSSMMNMTPDSSFWYRRHFERNNEISEVIGDTKYTQKAVVGYTAETVIITTGIVAGVAVFGVGVGLAGAIVYF